jgi:hypothetical protein
MLFLPYDTKGLTDPTPATLFCFFTRKSEIFGMTDIVDLPLVPHSKASRWFYRIRRLGRRSDFDHVQGKPYSASPLLDDI